VFGGGLAADTAEGLKQGGNSLATHCCEGNVNERAWGPGQREGPLQKRPACPAAMQLYPVVWAFPYHSCITINSSTNNRHGWRLPAAASNNIVLFHACTTSCIAR
jgi:hypothetical protein